MPDAVPEARPQGFRFDPGWHQGKPSLSDMWSTKRVAT
jgi:hypothetical protein